jgi:cell division inhibitor SepF
VNRYSSPEHPLSAAWWAELRRLLHLRPDPEQPDAPGLRTLFVRKRPVPPRQITTCYVRDLAHASHVADRLKAQYPVVVNLEEASLPDRPRVLDFVSGVTYSLDGSYEQLGEYVFLFVPGTVTITDEEEE